MEHENRLWRIWPLCATLIAVALSLCASARAALNPGRIRAYLTALLLAALLMVGLSRPASTQQSSVSTWDAADFRVWGFIPDWTPQSQIDSFNTNGMYNHVSDVIYFGGVRPNSAGDLTVTSHGATALPKLKTHAASHGFDLHLCMKAVTGGTEHTVWSALSSNAASEHLRSAVHHGLPLPRVSGRSA